MRVDRKCPRCGSTDICAAAVAYWSNAKQDWTLRGIDENNPWCDDCGWDGQGNTIKQLTIEGTEDEPE